MARIATVWRGINLHFVQLFLLPIQQKGKDKGIYIQCYNVLLTSTVCMASQLTFPPEQIFFRTAHSNLKLISKVGRYRGTNLIDLMLTSCWCQLANIIWTSTHEVNMMSRMCLENDHWQNNFVKTNFGWKKHLSEVFYINERHQFDANSWHQFGVNSWCYKTVHFLPMVDGQSMSTIEIIFMLIQCLVLIIYICLNIRALVEVKNALRI